jgi:hypothetical protein
VLLGFRRLGIRARTMPDVDVLVMLSRHDWRDTELYRCFLSLADLELPAKY